MRQWLPLKGLSNWSDYAYHTAQLDEKKQADLGVGAKRVILSVAHGSAVPEVDDADSLQWLHGLSMESRLPRWIASSDFVVLQNH